MFVSLAHCETKGVFVCFLGDQSPDLRWEQKIKEFHGLNINTKELCWFMSAGKFKIVTNSLLMSSAPRTTSMLT